jgi:hypothetical protein
MAKGQCPLCGGSIEIIDPKRGFGFIRWKCKRDGDDPNCKGHGNAGYKKKTGTPEGQPNPQPQNPPPGSAGDPGKPPGAGNPPGGPEPKPKFWDRPIFKL